jgi:phenylacetate-CoA ligase
LSPEKLDQFIEEIRAFRPAMLFGYPSALTLVAQRADDRGIRLDDLGIAVAFCTAERLYPHQRERVSQTFGCRVADGYGGRDAGFLAHECPEGGMHITAEDVIVETVDEGGRPVPNGEPGEVVVTHLFSQDFPFIRYKNGDVAVLSERLCSCGRGLPLIEEIQGRANDLLVGPDGARIHAIAFAMLLRDMPGVQQFKIIQESLELTRLQLVVGPNFDRTASRQRILEVFRHHLGQQTTVRIEEVESIAPEPTGKYRYVVSRVERERNAA